MPDEVPKLFSQPTAGTQRFELNDGCYGETVTMPNGDWTKRTYDAKGREIHFESSKGYWSRHCWTEYGDKFLFDSYYNCKGVWYRKLFDADGRLLWIEKESGRWETIVDTSHRLLYNKETKQFMIGSSIFNKQGALAHVLQHPRAVCPTVVKAIEATEEKPKQGFLTRVISFLLGRR